MKLHFPLLLCAVVTAAVPAFSQDTMRAIVRGNGNGDHGKCTIEVNVDSAAEVEVRGDSARIHTLEGQPSQFRRFECDSIMPQRPSDFRFKGIDGRGQMTLVQDPRQGGVAVIRIEDPKGGREGYTFDLEWQGRSGDYNNGRYGNDGRYNDGRSNDSRYNDGRYSDGNHRNDTNNGGYGYDHGGRGGMTVTCSSDNGHRQYCEADVRGDVRLVRQFSRAACRQGETWGFDSRGIWVDRGCGADFQIGR